MGIQGLTSLIDDNLHLLEDFQLHDSKVLIDGNNLFHLLYYSYNIDFTHGGDYDRFSRKIKEFFDIIKSCNIEAFIILDGGYEPDDRKLKTILERANTRIRLSECIASGQRGKILPILSYEVFITALNDLHIPHVTCDFEADNQIAVLANDFKCPVISFDSDFYILNLTNGFIPFDSVNFEVQPTVTRDNGKQYKYLPVKIYFTRNFISCFPELDKDVLPLMATVLGNDYVHIKTFEEFYSSLKVPKSLHSSISVSKTHTKMLKIVHWLESLKSIDGGVSKLVSCAKPDKREYVENVIKKSMDAYSNVTSYSSFNLFHFFTNQGESLKHCDTVSYHRNSIPAWFVDFHRRGKITVFMQNTLVLHRNILLCQVEDLKMPSSYNCSMFLRQILYSILLKNDLKVTTTDLRNEDTKANCVEEYDRQDRLKNLKKGLIPYVSSVDRFGEIPGLNDIEHMECCKKREFLCSVFNIDFKGEIGTVFSDGLALFVMAVIHWIRNADPLVNINMLKTIMLCWFSITARSYALESKQSDDTLSVAFSKSTPQQKEKLRKNLDKYFVVPQHSRKHPIDISIIHGFSQFQTCFLSTIHLNQILGYPFQSVNPAAVFSGSFLYNFCKDLQSRTNPDLFISEMLVKQSPVLSLYQTIILLILAQVDENCFAMATSSQNKKTRNRKKKPAVNSSEQHDSIEKGTGVCDDLESFSCNDSLNQKFTAMCELTNRFNFLDIGDLDEDAECS